jgi:hypothetical protein
MNERIKQLAEQSEFSEKDLHIQGDNFQMFAELIVQEHIDLLKQEWYALNNEPAVPGESPRDVGFRVGRKTEIINLIEKIKKHFNQA